MAKSCRWQTQTGTFHSRDLLAISAEFWENPRSVCVYIYATTRKLDIMTRRIAYCDAANTDAPVHNRTPTHMQTRNNDVLSRSSTANMN